MLMRTEVLPRPVAHIFKQLPNYKELTRHERQALELAVKGLTNKEIGCELAICLGTVKARLGVAREKLNFKRLPQLQYRLILIAAETAAH